MSFRFKSKRNRVRDILFRLARWLKPSLPVLWMQQSDSEKDLCDCPVFSGEYLVSLLGFAFR